MLRKRTRSEVSDRAKAVSFYYSRERTSLARKTETLVGQVRRAQVRKFDILTFRESISDDGGQITMD